MTKQKTYYAGTTKKLRKYRPTIFRKLKIYKSLFQHSFYKNSLFVIQ